MTSCGAFYEGDECYMNTQQPRSAATYGQRGVVQAVKLSDDGQELEGCVVCFDNAACIEYCSTDELSKRPPKKQKPRQPLLSAPGCCCTRSALLWALTLAALAALLAASVLLFRAHGSYTERLGREAACPDVESCVVPAEGCPARRGVPVGENSRDCRECIVRGCCWGVGALDHRLFCNGVLRKEGTGLMAAAIAAAGVFLLMAIGAARKAAVALC